jgi:hypothetical protein
MMRKTWQSRKSATTGDTNGFRSSTLLTHFLASEYMYSGIKSRFSRWSDSTRFRLSMLRQRMSFR